MPEAVAGGFPVTCGAIVGVESTVTPGHIIPAGRDVTMELIATSSTLFGRPDRPVVDRTGLPGTYDFTLEFTPDSPPGVTPLPNQDASGPSLPEALVQQLGLKLESQKDTVDVLVVDHIEHPSEN